MAITDERDRRHADLTFATMLTMRETAAQPLRKLVTT
jgi:hypothetical protein